MKRSHTNPFSLGKRSVHSSQQQHSVLYTGPTSKRGLPHGIRAFKLKQQPCSFLSVERKEREMQRNEGLHQATRDPIVMAPWHAHTLSASCSVRTHEHTHSPMTTSSVRRTTGGGGGGGVVSVCTLLGVAAPPVCVLVWDRPRVTERGVPGPGMSPCCGVRLNRSVGNSCSRVCVFEREYWLGVWNMDMMAMTQHRRWKRWARAAVSVCLRVTARKRAEASCAFFRS